MKVKKQTNSLTKTKKIPMDRYIVEFMGDFFGRNITNTTPSKSENTLTYSIKPNSNIQLEYEFNTKIIEEIKQQLNTDSQQEIKMGRLASKFWLTLIVLSYEQSKNIDNYKIQGKFKYSDIVKLWKVEKSGKLYSDIRNLFISLVSGKFTRTTQNKDKTEIEVYNLISYGKISEYKNNEDKTEFLFELDERALKLTADWIRYGKLSLARQQEGYLSIPISDLSESTKDTNYINFKEKLRLFSGKNISISTIINEWIKLSEDKSKRKTYCLDLLINCFNLAKNQGELKGYSFIKNDNLKWRERKIKIIK